MFQVRGFPKTVHQSVTFPWPNIYLQYHPKDQSRCFSRVKWNNLYLIHSRGETRHMWAPSCMEDIFLLNHLPKQMDLAKIICHWYRTATTYPVCLILHVSSIQSCQDIMLCHVLCPDFTPLSCFVRPWNFDFHATHWKKPPSPAEINMKVFLGRVI